MEAAAHDEVRNARAALRGSSSPARKSLSPWRWAMWVCIWLAIYIGHVIKLSPETYDLFSRLSHAVAALAVASFLPYVIWRYMLPHGAKRLLKWKYLLAGDKLTATVFLLKHTLVFLIIGLVGIIPLFVGSRHGVAASIWLGVIVASYIAHLVAIATLVKPGGK